MKSGRCQVVYSGFLVQKRRLVKLCEGGFFGNSSYFASQLKLLCFTTQVTLPFKVTYFQARKRLGFGPKIGCFGGEFSLGQFAKKAPFLNHLHKGVAEGVVMVGGGVFFLSFEKK